MSDPTHCDEQLALMAETHEFSEGYWDSKQCYYCGGYPFDLQHWTI